MSLDALVGFKGELAKIGQVDRKKIEGDVNVILDIGLDIQPDWCPAVKAKIDIDWKKGPKFEVASGVWLDFNFAAQLTSSSYEKEAEQIIQDMIDCTKIQTQITELVKPRSIPMGNRMKGMFVNVTLSMAN